MSRYRLRVLGKARSDLLSIKAWLTQPGSGRSGWGRYAAVIEAMMNLERAPHRWPTGDTAAVRERPVAGHRIYYRVYETDRRVEILRVFGPYQDRSSI